MSAQVRDKEGNAIDEGDRVFTTVKGHKREGEVEEIVMKAEKDKVADPPKVIFHDQNGHKVNEKPKKLENLDAGEKEDLVANI